MGESDDGHITQLEYEAVLEKHMGTYEHQFEPSVIQQARSNQAQNEKHYFEFEFLLFGTVQPRRP